jgi:Domain of unknown function (DUF6438)
MGEPTSKNPQMKVSLMRDADRIYGLNEVMFSINIAAAFVYALLVYISKNLASWTPENDSTYYFVRSAFRIDDLLHLPSTNPVSTSVVAREFPSRGSQIGDELLILVSVFVIAALILLLLRLTAGMPAYRIVLSRVVGVSALLALPACYLCVLRSTWEWPSGSFSVSPYPFWQSPRLTVFAAETLCLGILSAIYRRRSIPAWTLNTFLSFHYAFWLLVLLPEVRISMYRLYAPYFLLLAFPLSGLVSLRYLKTPHLHDAENGARGRAVKWTLATAIVAIALFSLVWLPGEGKTLARATNADSLTIQMSRGPCRGSCPSYTITIHGNGLVDYVGREHIRVQGPQTRRISREQVTEVLQSLERAHFRALEDRAFSWCFDTGSVSVSVSMDGKTKRVVSDDACTGAKSGLQAQFVKSAAEIDTIVGSNPWVSCDGPCWK